MNKAKMEKPKGISVGENWVIGTDGLQFISIKKVQGNNKDGEPIEYWSNEGYHPSVKFALESIAKEEILDVDLGDVNKVIAKIDELENIIENLGGKVNG